MSLTKIEFETQELVQLLIKKMLHCNIETKAETVRGNNIEETINKYGEEGFRYIDAVHIGERWYTLVFEKNK